MSIEEAAGSFNLTPHAFKLPFDLSEFSAVPHFVTRQDELEQMHKFLRGPGGRLTVILYGLGGMGKTQLAIAYMKRHYSEYPVAIWLNARDEIALKQSFARAAEKLRRLEPSLAYLAVALESRDLDEIWKAFKRWLEEPMNNQWIVTYDNYDDPRLDSRVTSGLLSHSNGTDPKGMFQGNKDGISSKAFDIRPYLPSTNHGSIIVTTRSSAVNFGPSIKIGKLKDVDDSLEILAQTSRRKNFKEDPAAVELAQRLDGCPLAIATAGAYLDQRAMSCTVYLQLYHDSWLQLHQETPQLPSYDQTLYSTWGISYSRIKQQSSVAAMLLRQWAYFGNEDLWYELLKEGRLCGPGWLRELTDSTLRFHGIMRILCDHGLVEADSATGKPESAGYSVHGCVHSWMIHVLNQEHDEGLALTAMGCIASHVPTQEQNKFWITQQRLMGHADRYMEFMIKMEVADEDAWAFHRLGSLYSDQGRLQEAEAMYKRALDGKEKVWGPDYTATLDTVNYLGNLYSNQGRLQEAEAMYKRALDGYEKVWGPDYTATLDTVNNLGNLYLSQGRLQEAEAMYKRALDGYEKVWGPEYTSTLEIVNNLGILYKVQGRPQEAEAMYTRALDGFEKSLGPILVATHKPTWHTLENLGDLYVELGQVTNALSCYRRAQSGIEAAFGRES